MKRGIIIVLLATVLASCAPAPTEIFIPIAASTPVLPTLAATLEVVPTVTPSPMPAQPTIVAITPDTIQVERWKDYQTALAKKLMSFLPPEKVLCEWEILGRSTQTLYIWAVCQGPLPGAHIDFASISIPAVIYLEEDGCIQSIEFPSAQTYDTGGISKMFPPDVREKFSYYNFGGAKKLLEHIVWRREHPEEPPLIVLLSTPMP